MLYGKLRAFPGIVVVLRLHSRNPRVVFRLNILLPMPCRNLLTFLFLLLHCLPDGDALLFPLNPNRLRRLRSRNLLHPLYLLHVVLAMPTWYFLPCNIGFVHGVPYREGSAVVLHARLVRYLRGWEILKCCLS